MKMKYRIILILINVLISCSDNNTIQSDLSNISDNNIKSKKILKTTSTKFNSKNINNNSLSVYKNTLFNVIKDKFIFKFKSDYIEKNFQILI